MPFPVFGLPALAACGVIAEAVPAGVAAVEVSDVSCSPDVVVPSFATTPVLRLLAVFAATFVVAEVPGGVMPVVTIVLVAAVCVATASPTAAAALAALASPVLAAASVPVGAGVTAGAVPLVSNWLAAIAAAAIAS